MSSEPADPRRGDARGQEFEQAASGKRIGVVSDFLRLLGETKKWWLAPILVLFLVLGLVVVLASTGAAPFIYTLW